MPHMSLSPILKFKPITLFNGFEESKTDFDGNVTTSSKLNAGVLNFFFLSL